METKTTYKIISKAKEKIEKALSSEISFIFLSSEDDEATTTYHLTQKDKMTGSQSSVSLVPNFHSYMK